MKKTFLFVLVLAVGLGTGISAQGAENPGTAPTVSLSLGYPTTLGIGYYDDLSILFNDADRNYVNGIEFNVYYGMGLNAPETFAKKEQKGLTEYDYWFHPETGATGSSVFGFNSYTYWYTLDLGFMALPIGSGVYLNFGGLTGDNGDKYMTVDGGIGVRAYALLEAVPFIKPYVELGLGVGSASPSNEAAHLKFTGGQDYFMSTAGTDEYKKWWSAKWDYSAFVINVGARYDLTFLGPKSAEEKAAEAKAKAEKEAAKQAEIAAKEKAKLGPFQFPEWLRDLGGVACYPDGQLSGTEIIGAEVFFGKYSFKHQSTVKDNKFTKKFSEDNVIEVVRADDSVYEVKLQGESGEEVYTLYRLEPGKAITVDGKEISSEEPGLYYDGKIYERIATSFQ